MIRILAVAFFCITSLSLPTFSDTTETSDQFRKLVKAGEIEAIEAFIADLDAQNTAPDFKRNRHLRAIFRQFSTTHPDYLSVLDAWEGAYPDSQYRKTALMWNLDHLGWIARGESFAAHVSQPAFDQMYARFQEAQNLAFDIFAKRQDFSPVNDFLAASYLNHDGVMPLGRFAKVALTANPDVSVLKKVIYAVTPHWGGSWEEMAAYCDAYADKMVVADPYNADVCKADAMFDLHGIYDGAYPELIALARDVAAKSGDRELAWLKRRLLFSVDRYLPLDPNAKDDILWLYKSDMKYAEAMAHKIAQTFDMPEFLEAELAKIEAAKELERERDPHNPKYKYMYFNRFSAEYREGSDENVAEKADAYSAAVLKLAPYRADVWVGRAQLYAATRDGGNADPRPTLDWWRHAVLLSNFDPKTLRHYYDMLSLSFVNLEYSRKRDEQKVAYIKPDNTMGELDISGAEMAEALACEAITITRFYQEICSMNPDNSSCDEFGRVKEPDAFLEEFRSDKLCLPALEKPVDALFGEFYAAVTAKAPNMQ